MKYSIIIPTKNEEEGIAKTICSIPNDIKKEAEIIVVDSSSDMTPKIAKCLGAIVLRTRRPGKGYAMKYAVKHAKGEILIFMDGDGTDPGYLIPKLLKKLDKNDMVLGTRSYNYSKQDDKKMRWVFRLYGAVILPAFKAVGWKANGDPLAGFRVLRKETWNKMNLKSNDFLIESEMNVRAIELGLKVDSVPIPHLKRAGGLFNSKLVTNPKQWLKITSYLLDHVLDKRIKSQLRTKFKKFKNQSGITFS